MNDSSSESPMEDGSLSGSEHEYDEYEIDGDEEDAHDEYEDIPDEEDDMDDDDSGELSGPLDIPLDRLERLPPAVSGMINQLRHMSRGEGDIRFVDGRGVDLIAMDGALDGALDALERSHPGLHRDETILPVLVETMEAMAPSIPEPFSSSATLNILRRAGQMSYSDPMSLPRDSGLWTVSGEFLREPEPSSRIHPVLQRPRPPSSLNPYDPSRYSGDSSSSYEQLMSRMVSPPQRNSPFDFLRPSASIEPSRSTHQSLSVQESLDSVEQLSQVLSNQISPINSSEPNADTAGQSENNWAASSSSDQPSVRASPQAGSALAPMPSTVNTGNPTVQSLPVSQDLGSSAPRAIEPARISDLVHDLLGPNITSVTLGPHPGGLSGHVGIIRRPFGRFSSRERERSIPTRRWNYDPVGHGGDSLPAMFGGDPSLRHQQSSERRSSSSNGPIIAAESFPDVEKLESKITGCLESLATELRKIDTKLANTIAAQKSKKEKKEKEEKERKEKEKREKDATKEDEERETVPPSGDGNANNLDRNGQEDIPQVADLAATYVGITAADIILSAAEAIENGDARARVAAATQAERAAGEDAARLTSESRMSDEEPEPEAESEASPRDDVMQSGDDSGSEGRASGDAEPDRPENNDRDQSGASTPVLVDAAQVDADSPSLAQAIAMSLQADSNPVGVDQSNAGGQEANDTAQQSDFAAVAAERAAAAGISLDAPANEDPEVVAAAVASTGIDPTFLAALPEEMRAEVLAQHFEQIRTASAPASEAADLQATTTLNQDFLIALPPALRAEVLEQEAEYQARRNTASNPGNQDSARNGGDGSNGANGSGNDQGTSHGPPDVEMDNATFLATLPSELREEILLTSGEQFLSSLPPAMATEARMLRERQLSSRLGTGWPGNVDDAPALFRRGMFQNGLPGSHGRREGRGPRDSVRRELTGFRWEKIDGKWARIGPKEEDEPKSFLDGEGLRAVVQLLKQSCYGKAVVHQVLSYACKNTQARKIVLTELLSMVIGERRPSEISLKEKESSYSAIQASEGTIVRRALELLTQLCKNDNVVAETLIGLAPEGSRLDEEVNSVEPRSPLSGLSTLTSLLNTPLFVRSNVHLEQLLIVISTVCQAFPPEQVGKTSKQKQDIRARRARALVNMGILEDHNHDDNDDDDDDEEDGDDAGGFIDIDEGGSVGPGPAISLAARIPIGDDDAGEDEDSQRSSDSPPRSLLDLVDSAVAAVEGVAGEASRDASPGGDGEASDPVEAEAREDNASTEGNDQSEGDRQSKAKKPEKTANPKIPPEFRIPRLSEADLNALVLVLRRPGCSDKGYDRASKALGQLGELPVNKSIAVEALAKSAKDLSLLVKKSYLEFVESLKNVTSSANSVNSKRKDLVAKFAMASYACELTLLRLVKTAYALLDTKSSDGDKKKQQSDDKEKLAVDRTREHAELSDSRERVFCGLQDLWSSLNDVLDNVGSDVDGQNQERRKSGSGSLSGIRFPESVTDGLGRLGRLRSARRSLSPVLARLSPVIEAFFIAHYAVQDESEFSEDVKSPKPESPMKGPSTTPQALERADSIERAASSQSQLPVLSTRSKQLGAFIERHRVPVNVLLRSNPSLLETSFRAALRYSQAIDFDNKKAYFRNLIRKRSSEAHAGTIRINVRRAFVFYDSYRQLRHKSKEDMKGRLHVQFLGEEGIDAGGVTREWYVILARQIFDPNYALFCKSAAKAATYQPDKRSHINREHLDNFRFVGRIIGKAIYDGQLLDAYFTRSFYKHILGIKPTYHDIEAQDPDYFNSLKWILENDITGVLDHTMSAEYEEFGQRKIIDLMPNGRNIAVTEENKAEYVRLVTEVRLTKAIEKQINAFKEGFHELIPPEDCKIFNELELELLMSGLPDIDMADLKANVEYTGYTASSPQINWFWRCVGQMDQEDLARLVMFVTGTSKVPLEGFSALQGMNGTQKFQIHRVAGDTNRLPSAHTCFNQLDLPEYSSEETLSERLLRAVRECNVGFGFA